MAIIIKNINMDDLHDNSRLAEFTLIGDGSYSSNLERSSWCCFILSKDGIGEVIYGVEANESDVHVSELTPYCYAMRSLSKKLMKNLVYRYRLHVITDNQNLVAHHNTGSYNRHTSGLWAEFRSYEEEVFDVHFEHQARRSNNILKFVDDIIDVLKESHTSVDDKVKKFCKNRQQTITRKEET